jgi:alkylhydroperoxidase family enzyme
VRLDTPRLPPLPEAEWDDDVRDVLKGVALGGARPLNIFSTLAHHPKLMKRWLVFGNHVLAKSSLSPRERELAILRVGWRWRSEYEFGQHVLIARGVGIPDADIERVAQGPDAPGWDPFEATLLRAVDELCDDAFVSDATWKALAARYDARQLIDLVFTVGQYTLVSMALNTLGVQRDPGVPGFPKPPR